LRKLPGRYFYGLGTRLDKLRWTLVTEDCNLPLFLWRGCSSSSELCPNTMPNTGEYHSLWVAMVMAADVLYMWCVCVQCVCNACVGVLYMWCVYAHVYKGGGGDCRLAWSNNTPVYDLPARKSQNQLHTMCS